MSFCNSVMKVFTFSFPLLCTVPRDSNANPPAPRVEIPQQQEAPAECLDRKERSPNIAQLVSKSTLISTIAESGSMASIGKRCKKYAAQDWPRKHNAFPDGFHTHALSASCELKVLF